MFCIFDTLSTQYQGIIAYYITRFTNILFLIRTHIHNWSLQPFSQAYDLASHDTYVVCVNFIYKWRDLKFKVDSEQQTFIYSQSFCQKSAGRKPPKKYFHIFVLMSDQGFELGPYV